MTSSATDRERAKADRHDALLREAARLFADRGFSGVSLEDLGAAVGVSGPAVYRHFSGKQALLAAILVGVSERLHAGGTEVAAAHDTAADRLVALTRFHVAFALSEADVIRVQDRDLANLSAGDARTVRRLQRDYVAIWTDTLGALLPHAEPAELRVRVYACFGLINSTPHSVRGVRWSVPDGPAAPVLEAMALAALTAGADD
jgi:AcrR family transcriptional regulator